MTLFQSTLPLRGATNSSSFKMDVVRYFNPRSPCGERLAQAFLGVNTFLFQSTLPLRGATGRQQDCGAGGLISIHAPLAGSDPNVLAITTNYMIFQSTLPLRGATLRLPFWKNEPQISIHAPLAGSDGTGAWKPCILRYFNPRSPCGERLKSMRTVKDKAVFQSTLPLRGATPGHPARQSALPISIHAPLAGSDYLY